MIGSLGGFMTTTARRTTIATIATIAAAALLGTSALAACSSSSTTGSASPSVVGGMTECTNEAVGQAAQAAAEAMSPDNLFQLDSVECADGWAVASGVLGAKADAANTSAPVGAPTTMVFEAEGQFWIPKDKALVCGTFNASDPNAVPADATIPSALYTSGCLTG